jgi:hypothetical protein
MLPLNCETATLLSLAKYDIPLIALSIPELTKMKPARTTNAQSSSGKRPILTIIGIVYQLIRCRCCLKDLEGHLLTNLEYSIICKKLFRRKYVFSLNEKYFASSKIVVSPMQSQMLICAYECSLLR